MNGYSVRRFRESGQEYEFFASLLSRAKPGRRAATAEELRQEDADWPDDSLLERVAALSEDGEIVAFGTCYQAYWQQKSGTVYLHFDIHPDHFQAQILPVLFTAMEELPTRREVDFQRLVCRAREDDNARVQFLVERGFEQAMRFPSSALHVADFDPAVCGETFERLVRSQIRSVSLTQLQELEPEWKRKLCDLRWEIIQDVPSTEPFSRPTLAEFEEMVLKDPALDQEGFFVALSADDSFIGMSNLWRNDPEGKRLDSGLTGIVRAYRRHGIATALKMRTILYARSAGAETIETSNEEDSPMFALNLKLGFKPKPAWIDYSRDAFK